MPDWDKAFSPENIEEEIKDDFSSDLSILINNGRLTSTFEFWGHKIIIHTLKMNEELKASSIANAYSDNLDRGTKAFIAAMASSCIVSVDGTPLVMPLGPDDDTVQQRKFDYVVNHYYYTLVEHIYEEYIKLSRRIEEAVEEFKKK